MGTRRREDETIGRRWYHGGSTNRATTPTVYDEFKKINCTGEKKAMPPGLRKREAAGAGGGAGGGAEERVAERVATNEGERGPPLNTTDAPPEKQASNDPKNTTSTPDPKGRPILLRKRPRSIFPPIEDVTTTELATLIQKAVKEALKETDEELKKLRK
ncbi:hypothetical protein EX30DRAFT_366885 [Ascodesmis nigricans]|uniref:Uncharacterized protein n=1 Tax=Ascodesmis nigricans TaxID=341454 RepID=A0A4S2MJH7_9PEZI|nr:hypothetical protein EX30DRAFT_366885 [Ascodesmis nigricans]